MAAATGFFVIDPAEDCTQMGDVKRLLTSWSEGQAGGRLGMCPEDFLGFVDRIA